MKSYLHGVETIERFEGAIQVRTIPTAIVGIIGTAPDAEPATAASGLIGSVALDNALVFTAKKAGSEGNKLKVKIIAGDAEKVTIVGDTTEITVITEGDDPTTCNKLVTMVNGLQNNLVSAALYANVTGASQPALTDSTSLTDGADEPFPLNMPVLLMGSPIQAKKLGSSGTLYQGIMEVFDQQNTLVIACRAQEDVDSDKQRAYLINAISGLYQSEQITTYRPRILIAPGHTEDDGVAKALETLAYKLRAVAYVDIEAGASLVEAVKRRQLYGERVEIQRPRVKVVMPDGSYGFRPYSAFAAGLRARIDNEKGWWWSKSNQNIKNISGVEQIDLWFAGEEFCDANQLNANEVSTIILRSGFKHWGNRLCSTHPQLSFESVRRSADVIADSIEKTVMEYIDRPLDKGNVTDILETINSYMRQLAGMGAIHGGSAWLDEELNTEESLASGWIWINYDAGYKSPTERITLQTYLNNKYGLQEINSI